jgi:putative IMPACT (imprinted ancient) family translation regulator
VVVVRYFGGTLLGVPGLINAYKSATEDALNIATIIEKTLDDTYIISFDYQQMNDVMKIIKEDNLTILEQQLDNTCMVKLAIRKMQVNRSINKLEKIDSAIIKLAI